MFSPCARTAVISFVALFIVQFLPAQLNYKINGASERAGETAAGASVDARINMLQSSAIPSSTTAASGLDLCHNCIGSGIGNKAQGRFSNSITRNTTTQVYGQVPIRSHREMIHGEYPGMYKTPSFRRGAASLFTRATSPVDRRNNSDAAITSPYRNRSQFDAFGVGSESMSRAGFYGQNVASAVYAPVSEAYKGAFPDSTKGNVEVSPPDLGTQSPLEWNPSINFAFDNFEEMSFLNPQFRVGMRRKKPLRAQKRKQTTTDDLLPRISNNMPESGSLIESQNDINQKLDSVIQ